NEDDEARPLDAPEASELEQHAALVLAQDAQRAGEDQDRQDQDRRNADRDCPHRAPSEVAASGLGGTSRVTTSTRVMRTRWPASNGAAARTRQRSPATIAHPSPAPN